MFSVFGVICASAIVMLCVAACVCFVVCAVSFLLDDGLMLLLGVGLSAAFEQLQFEARKMSSATELVVASASRLLCSLSVAIKKEGVRNDTADSRQIIRMRNSLVD